jgi:hypothetical protein
MIKNVNEASAAITGLGYKHDTTKADMKCIPRAKWRINAATASYTKAKPLMPGLPALCLLARG